MIPPCGPASITPCWSECEATGGPAPALKLLKLGWENCFSVERPQLAGEESGRHLSGGRWSQVDPEAPLGSGTRRGLGGGRPPWLVNAICWRICTAMSAASRSPPGPLNLSAPPWEASSAIAIPGWSNASPGARAPARRGRWSSPLSKVWDHRWGRRVGQDHLFNAILRIMAARSYASCSALHRPWPPGMGETTGARGPKTNPPLLEFDPAAFVQAQGPAAAGVCDRAGGG